MAGRMTSHRLYWRQTISVSMTEHFIQTGAVCVLKSEKTLYARIWAFNMVFTLYFFMFQCIRKYRDTRTRMPLFLTAAEFDAVLTVCSNGQNTERFSKMEHVPIVIVFSFFRSVRHVGT